MLAHIHSRNIPHSEGDKIRSLIDADLIYTPSPH